MAVLQVGELAGGWENVIVECGAGGVVACGRGEEREEGFVDEGADGVVVESQDGDWFRGLRVVDC